MFEDSERYCTPQDAANLKYLDCCIKEALRLFPSIPGVMRTITEEVKIGKCVETYRWLNYLLTNIILKRWIHFTERIISGAFVLRDA